MSRVVVTGAGGTLGRRLVPRLVRAGHEVVATSRKPRAARDSERWAVADVKSGAGLDTALRGAEVIVHCATTARSDETAAQVLLGAAPRDAHVVYISIVGVDRVPLGYYRSKLAAERVFTDSGRPVTIQRATQFHELVRGVFRTQERLPMTLVFAGTSIQPVDSGEVADRLVALAGAEPAGRATDLGGPEVRAMTELAREYQDASGRRRRTLGVRLPGRTFAAYRAGGHLVPEHADGTITFAQFLAAEGANRTSS